MNADDQKVLTGPNIKAACEVVGTFEIRLEWSDGYQCVKFRIVEWTNGSFEFYQSHFLKPPGRSAPYQTSNTKAPTKGDAMRLAVDSIMREYNPVFDQGPSHDWFVRNECF